MRESFVYPPPSDGKPFRLVMGLRELNPDYWFESGSDVEEQLLERNRLIENLRETVFQVLPGHDSALHQFIAEIVGNLRDHHPEYTVRESLITHTPTGIAVDLTKDHPLIQLGKVLCEDICLMAKVNGVWTLVAGVVVFPSRWDLREKIGKDIDSIHTPVPGYGQALAPYMSATFEKIKEGRPVWRRNWSLHSTKDLHQPTSIHAESKPENYWWRTERQTLTRLGDGEYLLFTIRNRAEPLEWITKDSESAAAFADTLESMSDETLEYKSLTKDKEAIVDYLRGRRP